MEFHFFPFFFWSAFSFSSLSFFQLHKIFSSLLKYSFYSRTYIGYLNYEEGVPIVAQLKWIWLVSVGTWVQSLASFLWLRIQHCHGSGAGRRHGSDLVFLWLWRGTVAAALIWPLAWEPPYAMGVAPKKTKNIKYKELFSFPFFFFFFFRAQPAAYGSFQARGWITTVAAGLYHSHSHATSKPHLSPTL